MAIEFNGTTDYIECGAANMPAANAPQSISCWFRYTALPTKIENLVSLANDGASSTIELGWRNPAGTYYLLAWSYGTNILVNSVTQPSINVWHHVVYTFDGTNHRIYLDGALLATSGTVGTSAVPNEVHIGAYVSPTYRQPFTGRMEDVRVYNRQLSDAEVQTMYTARGVDGILDGLVSRWPLNEYAPGYRAA